MLLILGGILYDAAEQVVFMDTSYSGRLRSEEGDFGNGRAFYAHTDCGNNTLANSYNETEKWYNVREGMWNSLVHSPYTTHRSHLTTQLTSPAILLPPLNMLRNTLLARTQVQRVRSRYAFHSKWKLRLQCTIVSQVFTKTTTRTFRPEIRCSSWVRTVMPVHVQQ